MVEMKSAWAVAGKKEGGGSLTKRKERGGCNVGNAEAWEKVT